MNKFIKRGKLAITIVIILVVTTVAQAALTTQTSKIYYFDNNAAYLKSKAEPLNGRLNVQFRKLYTDLSLSELNYGTNGNAVYAQFKGTTSSYSNVDTRITNYHY